MNVFFILRHKPQKKSFRYSRGTQYYICDMADFRVEKQMSEEIEEKNPKFKIGQQVDEPCVCVSNQSGRFFVCWKNESTIPILLYLFHYICSALKSSSGISEVINVNCLLTAPHNSTERRSVVEEVEDEVEEKRLQVSDLKILNLKRRNDDDEREEEESDCKWKLRNKFWELLATTRLIFRWECNTVKQSSLKWKTSKVHDDYVMVIAK